MLNHLLKEGVVQLKKEDSVVKARILLAPELKREFASVFGPSLQ